MGSDDKDIPDLCQRFLAPWPAGICHDAAVEEARRWLVGLLVAPPPASTAPATRGSHRRIRKPSVPHGTSTGANLPCDIATELCLLEDRP